MRGSTYTPHFDMQNLHLESLAYWPVLYEFIFIRLCALFSYVQQCVWHTPPDIIFWRWFFDNSLVQRWTTCLCTRVGSESTSWCDGTTSLIDKCIFVEGSDGRIRDLADMLVSHMIKWWVIKKKSRKSYNCNTIVVNMCCGMKFLFQLCMLSYRPKVLSVIEIFPLNNKKERLTGHQQDGVKFYLPYWKPWCAMMSNESLNLLLQVVVIGVLFKMLKAASSSTW